MNLNPVYGLLLLFSTIITYTCGIAIEKNDKQSKRKLWLTITLLLNFGILFIFKYYNFLNETISSLMESCGIRWNVPYLKLLMPIGISFYTFQAAGYIIDIYQNKYKAEKNFITYSLFVSFFPVILAGPIQRGHVLLPQLRNNHSFSFENLIHGGKSMIWGYFMKLCVADRLGTYVDTIFNNLPNHNGTSVLIAVILYAVQIYCDFSGYSLIAIGAAKVMGFDLPDNFKRPYFAISTKDFWKRWHIALSSWFMNYLYFPLGGNRVKYYRYLINLMIVFLVSGLWHGAAWTFILWGAIHGLYQVLEALSIKCFGKRENLSPFVKMLKMLFTFILVSFAWIFFRANSIDDAFYAIQKIFTNPGMPFISPMAMLYGFISMGILFVKDFADEFKPNWKFFNSDNKMISVMVTAALCVYIILFGVIDNSQFIYFQF